MIVLRHGRESDHPYVYSTFTRSYPRVSAYAEGLPAAVLAQLLDPIIELWQLHVACPDDDPDLVLGWVLSDGPTRVAYLFVNKPFRGQGIARQLLENAVGVKPGPITTPYAPTRLKLPQRYYLKFRPWDPLALAAVEAALGDQNRD